MATPVEIATVAAGAFVGAMGTDTWGLVRERFAGFFRQHASAEEQTALAVRLEGFERDVVAALAEEREGTVEVYARSVARDLASLTERSTEAADELSRLVTELGAVTHVAGGSTVVNSGVRIEHNDVKRDLNFGGHTNTVGERT